MKIKDFIKEISYCVYPPKLKSPTMITKMSVWN